MLEDPPVNFAISTRGQGTGIDHLGFQVDNDTELAELRARAAAAEGPVLDEGATSCCYARSEKHWTTDPQGVAWEHFHTLGNIAVFGESKVAAAKGGAGETAGAAASGTAACCPPRGKPVAVPVKASGNSCC
jgi:lactoylglutathione lyase